jgi:hypothetical protein
LSKAAYKEHGILHKKDFSMIKWKEYIDSAIAMKKREFPQLKFEF